MYAPVTNNYLIEDLPKNLAQFEMQEAIQELESAIESQEQWYADLNKVLLFKLKPNRQDLCSNSHHLCALGAWLDVYGNDNLRNLPLFKKIKRNHELLHHLASALLLKMLKKKELDPAKYEALYDVEKLLRHQLRILEKKISENMNNNIDHVGYA